MTDIDKLEAVAAAAMHPKTPGPWFYPIRRTPLAHEMDAEFIATFNPATVKLLLDVVRAAQKRYAQDEAICAALAAIGRGADRG